MLQALNSFGFFIGAFVALVLSFVGFVVIIEIEQKRLEKRQHKHWADFLISANRIIDNIIERRFKEIERGRDENL